MSGQTTYVYSDYFQIKQAGTYGVTNLTFTNTPPPLPVSIRAVVDDPTLTTQTQVHVTALYANGGSSDVTPRAQGSIYRISNLSIATVSSNGLVTALKEGTAVVTVVNDGATSVTRIDVLPGATLTTLTGFVQDQNGAPVANSTINLLGVVGSTTTDSQGRFTLPGLAVSSNIFEVIVQVFTTNNTLFGVPVSVPLVSGGFTDVGIMTIDSLCDVSPINCVDTDSDGLSDTLEVALGYNANSVDSDTNGVLDGAENYDADGLSNTGEALVGADPTNMDTDNDSILDGDEDSDFDGLLDGQELSLGTDPLDPDTDNDWWNDEVENQFNSDPLDPTVTPDALVVATPLVETFVSDTTGTGVDLSLTVGQPPVSTFVSDVTGNGVELGLTVGQPPVTVSTNAP